MATTFKTLSNEIIPEGERLPNEFLMIDENGKAVLVEFKDGDCKISPFAADLLAIVEGTYVPSQPQQAKPQVTYIATTTEYFGWLEVKVLASNARSSQYVGRCKTTDECQELVKKFGNVSWVTSYRFQKELRAC